jgi:hypothetical protein
MRKSEVLIGAVYIAKVSGKLARVRVDRVSELGGWDATNIRTGRKVHIRGAMRLRRLVSAPALPAPQRKCKNCPHAVIEHGPGGCAHVEDGAYACGCKLDDDQFQVKADV